MLIRISLTIIFRANVLIIHLNERVKIIDKEEKSSKQYYLLDFSSLIRQV